MLDRYDPRNDERARSDAFGRAALPGQSRRHGEAHTVLASTAPTRATLFCAMLICLAGQNASGCAIAAAATT